MRSVQLGKEEKGSASVHVLCLPLRLFLYPLLLPLLLPNPLLALPLPPREPVASQRETLLRLRHQEGVQRRQEREYRLKEDPRGSGREISRKEKTPILIMAMNIPSQRLARREVAL